MGRPRWREPLHQRDARLSAGRHIFAWTGRGSAKMLDRRTRTFTAMTAIKSLEATRVCGLGLSISFWVKARAWSRVPQFDCWTTMKRISIFLLCLVFAASLPAGIPTPESAMTFHMDKDPRKWTPQYQNGSKSGFVMEFVPEGDSIKKWKEMAALQIAFTK